MHGTPGSRVSRFPIGDPYADAGVCVAQYDRPGYGDSTRRPGRTVADCVADVAALADELGWERFAVTGGSGGGPHSLACAALLPDRVIRATCDVGIAPWNAEGLDYFGEGRSRVLLAAVLDGHLHRDHRADVAPAAAAQTR